MKKLVAIVAAWTVGWAWAGQINYNTASGVKDLAQGSAWVGGIAPGENDVAVLAGVGGDFTISAPVAWQGLSCSGLAALVRLRATNGATLTLGAGGVKMGSASAKPGESMAIYVPVVLACDQEWYTRDTHYGAVAIYGGVTGKDGATYKLTLRNYAGVAESWYGIRSAVNADFGAHGTTMNLLDATGKVTGAVDTGWKHSLVVLNADKGETAFADLFESRKIVNDGEVRFGDKLSGSDVRSDVLFQNGDRIVGNETLTFNTALDAENDKTGAVYQYLGAFHMTGGTISNNVFTLRAGDYVQEGGDVWLREANPIEDVTFSACSFVREDDKDYPPWRKQGFASILRRPGLGECLWTKNLVYDRVTWSGR